MTEAAAKKRGNNQNLFCIFLTKDNKSQKPWHVIEIVRLLYQIALKSIFFLSFCSIILFFSAYFVCNASEKLKWISLTRGKKETAKTLIHENWHCKPTLYHHIFFFREINYGCVNDWVNQNGTFMVKWRWFWWCQNISWSIWPKLSYLKLKKKWF